MAFTYSFDTAYDLSVVRLMVSDTDETRPIFSDAEVQAAIDINNSQKMIVGLTGFNVTPPVVISYRLAAAMLLRSLAADKARLGGLIKVLDVDIDTTATAKFLRDSAKELEDAERNAGYFAVAEMVQDAFSMRERLWKQLLRIYA